MNLFSIQRWVPPEGIAIKLYPNTNNPSSWILLLEKSDGSTKYIEIPRDVVPRGVPDSGVELSAKRDVTQDGNFYCVSYGALHATTARQITVPGKTAIKKAVEDVSKLDLSSLTPHLMRLLN